ncbi:ribosome biogenesis protein WDR12 homolog [Coccinella septempunctata]|uniref:ribosome biogenesis protein WDR12 homolog n=1 Tax=Coccinella septempunctata TaxID=41139 RepID=UPI001D094020|nr:ribosome biogenesis protein WDR12 homolog [Coccinella septempunctata]
MSEEGVMEIRLISKQEAFALPDIVQTIPKSIDKNSLNEIVKQLLKESHLDSVEDLEFDFIIVGELLRSTVGEHLSEKSISTESTVDIEYVERTPAPEPEDSILHDDWVSSIHTCAGKWILTGCYDHSVYLWTSHGKSIVSIKNHSDFVKDVKWISKDDPQKGFVSVSEDQTAVLWSWEEGTTKAKSVFVLKGHSRGIECVDVSPNTEKLATGGWDTTLKIWSASLEKDEEEPALKKSKSKDNVNVRTPINTLEGHKQAITSVQWMDPHNIITGSMDHTVRVWDAELNGMKNEIIGHKAFLSSSWSPLANSLLTSSADQYIRLYDPRSTEGAICRSSFISHTRWVSSVEWSPYSEYLFLSGGYDSKVMMWDTRSPKAPLFNLQDHMGKVFKVDWSNRNYLLSGGDDNHVHIFKNRN